MTHGGKREGAGRKPGTPNKASQEQREAIAASGLTPLDYMLNILRDEEQPEDARFEAAKAAAPYVHARLAAVAHSGGMTLTHEEALQALNDPGGEEDSHEAEG